METTWKDLKKKFPHQLADWILLLLFGFFSFVGGAVVKNSPDVFTAIIQYKALAINDNKQDEAIRLLSQAVKDIPNIKTDLEIVKSRTFESKESLARIEGMLEVLLK